MDTKILVTIPLFINKNPEECFLFLEKTIKSIKKYSIFWEILIFYCQEEMKNIIFKKTKIYDNIRLIFIKEKNPKYLPIDVFNFMSNNKSIKYDAYIFYTENDHILHLDENILKNILDMLDKKYIIMPHRLWHIKASQKMQYIKHNWFWVWNYSAKSIIKFDNTYDLMWDYYHKWEHNDYAWCYFTKKSTIEKINIPKYYSYIWKIMMWVLWKRSFFPSRFLPKWINLNIIKKRTIPYWLILEAPSLILAYRWLKVLKTKEIDKLYVEHLSNNWYV